MEGKWKDTVSWARSVSWTGEKVSGKAQDSSRWIDFDRMLSDIGRTHFGRKFARH